MKQIRWFEKYGLGTIDIIDTTDSLAYTRYEISSKLYKVIKQYINIGQPFMSKDPKEMYFNPRIAQKGASIRFSVRRQFGVAGIISDKSHAQRERQLSDFSKFVARQYSK